MAIRWSYEVVVCVCVCVCREKRYTNDERLTKVRCQGNELQTHIVILGQNSKSSRNKEQVLRWEILSMDIIE